MKEFIFDNYNDIIKFTYYGSRSIPKTEVKFFGGYLRSLFVFRAWSRRKKIFVHHNKNIKQKLTRYYKKTAMSPLRK